MYSFAKEIETNLYVNPYEAVKTNNYQCLDCERTVILKKGEKKRPHFAHKVEDGVRACDYYDRGGEGSAHLSAKELICKSYTDGVCGSVLNFKIKNCDHCESGNIICPRMIYPNSIIIPEYPILVDGVKRRADLAIIDDNDVKLIIEICDTHKTKPECRPPTIPWIEVSATNVVSELSGNLIGVYTFDDIRNVGRCDRCNKNIEMKRLERMKAEATRLEAERIERVKADAAAKQARLEEEYIERALVAAAAKRAKLEAERIEKARAEAERIEAERIEKARVEAERIEAERKQACLQRIAAKKARLAAAAEKEAKAKREALSYREANRAKLLKKHPQWAERFKVAEN